MKQEENIEFVHGSSKRQTPVQHGVDFEYIVWLTVGDQPTDTTTLTPFIKIMENFLYFKYFKIIVDSDYKNEENYVYVKENGQLSYIKPANYEI